MSKEKLKALKDASKRASAVYAKDDGLLIEFNIGTKSNPERAALFVEAPGLFPDSIKLDGETLARFVSKKGLPERVEVEGDRLALYSGKLKAFVGFKKEAGILNPFRAAGEGKPIPSDFWGITHAAATEEYRAIFRGVSFQDGLAVATDGFRLAIYRYDFGNRHERVVNRLAVNTAKKYGAKKIFFGEKGVFFIGDGFMLFSEYIPGVFPDWKRVIPVSYSAVISVDKKALKEIIPFLDKDTPRVDLMPDGRLKAEEAEVEGAVVFEAEGEHGFVAYNAHYLLDALEWVGDGAEIFQSGVASPGVVKNDSPREAVIVPLRV